MFYTQNLPETREKAFLATAIAIVVEVAFFKFQVGKYHCLIKTFNLQNLIIFYMKDMAGYFTCIWFGDLEDVAKLRSIQIKIICNIKAIVPRLPSALM